ncbi:hypothetical protein C8F04DRAFT_1177295 [Mycena alexandri]|uniref:Uncharacterized protein n=1 Tax=Mycena alexandri TaxID=1745969 RepID=A0AAD6T960_9AGAR|nr:hypothetical protein C8F04DRAFT_1177295 [Mycena alexandri]
MQRRVVHPLGVGSEGWHGGGGGREDVNWPAQRQSHISYLTVSRDHDQSVTLVNKYPVWVWLDAPLQAINGATQATCGGLNANKDDEQVGLYTDKGDVWTGKHIDKAGVQSQSTTDKHAAHQAHRGHGSR